MQTASLICFWLAFAFYIGATVLYAYQLAVRSRLLAVWGTVLTGIGLALHTLSIGLNSVVHGGTVYTGENLLVLWSWALVLVYFLVEHVFKIRALGVFLLPAAVVLMAVAQVVGGPGAGYDLTAEQARLLEGYGIGLHVGMVVFADAAFVIAGLAAALYLFQNQRLRQGAPTGLSRHLPSLTLLKATSWRAIAFGFPVYTAGLTLGVLRAVEADVAGWWSDLRIVTAGVIWATYGLYLLLHARNSVSLRSLSWLSIFGAILVLVVAVLARTVPTGFHVFAL